LVFIHLFIIILYIICLELKSKKVKEKPLKGKSKDVVLNYKNNNFEEDYQQEGELLLDSEQSDEYIDFTISVFFVLSSL